MKPYRRVLSSAQKKLSAEINQIRASVPHAGETGALIENRIRSALLTVLPQKVGVSNGFVADSEGGVSKQMDIILYDKLNTPKILSSEGAQIFPVESTYACGEIKTSLNMQSLEDVYQKCISYKTLTRKAYFENTGVVQRTFSLFGEPHEQWQSIFICIAAKSVSIESLCEMYRAVCIQNVMQSRSNDTEEFKNRIDAIFSLNGPCIINSSKPIKNGRPQESSIDLLPSAGGEFGAYPAKEPWALFVNLLLRYMVNAPQVRVNMLMYDSGEPF